MKGNLNNETGSGPMMIGGSSNHTIDINSGGGGDVRSDDDDERGGGGLEEVPNDETSPSPPLPPPPPRSPPCLGKIYQRNPNDPAAPLVLVKEQEESLFLDDKIKNQNSNGKIRTTRPAQFLRDPLADKTQIKRNRPSYISYLDNASSHHGNPNAIPGGGQRSLLPLGVDLEPMPMPIPDNNAGYDDEEHQIPGAYSETPGRAHRLDQLNFSLVGVEPPAGMLLSQATMHLEEEEEPSSSENNVVVGLGLVERDIERGGRGTLPNLDDNNQLGTAAGGSSGDLVHALPVNSSRIFMNLSSRRRMTAQPVDPEQQQQAAATAKKASQCKWLVALVCGITVLVVVVVLVAVALTTKNNNNNNKGENRTALGAHPPAGSPTTTTYDRPLPPPNMENLELLYQGLPEETKDSLTNITSPQYQAWEWLWNHPNLTTFPEWRKQQIFAMSTLFLTLQGPDWPDETPGRDRWMDLATNECDWVLSDQEVQHWAHQSLDVLGPRAYQPQDFQPCNSNGELQSLFFHQLYSFTDVREKPKLKFPPEIGLLSSLKILGIGWSSVNAKLSDLLIPEVVQDLPQLEMLVFQNSGVSGPIPRTISQLTNLRHLLIGANNLVGTIPAQDLLQMTSLEHFMLDNMGEDVTGTLPSELGLMTSLTGLEMDRNSFAGPIPSQMGLLTSITRLALYGNQLTGSLPTELGFMTNMAHLRIWNNALTGPIPSQLGVMTNLVDLRIGNDDLTTTMLSSGRNNNNNFTGTFPQELWWELSQLESLHLPNLPNLHGSIPTNIAMPNLTLLSLSGSPNIVGAIPDQACVFVEELDFDCSDVLCGCDCLCQ